MPVEIRELHIRVAVNAEAGKPSASAKSTDREGADKEAIVAECVEQVLQIMQTRKER